MSTLDLGSTPLVSILIPAYNHEKYIGEVLDSFLFITYSNIELVIIDDGSTDDTPNIIEKWVVDHQDEIHVNYYSRENKGCSATQNELINRARGEFVIPSSSDDYLLPHSVEKLVKAAQKFPNKNIFFGDGIVIDGKGKKIKDSILEDLNNTKKINLLTEKTLPEEIISRWSISGPQAMMRRDVYNKLGMYDNNLVIQDWDFYLSAIAGNHVLFIDEPICAYRVHSFNTSRVKDRTLRIKNLQDQFHVARRNRNLFTGRLKNLLKTEEIFLKMKMLFLNRNYIKLSLLTIYYVFFCLLTKASFSLENFRKCKKNAI
ncbi:MAG: glycosyltransferase [Alphaproteobacteria bacterium]|nr:glycosyltransferase [Alphaproteobacteria bacterium]